MYKVFYYRSNIGIDPAYLILKANSVEDAILKADIDPTMIYGVWELESWIRFCEERRGYYLGKDLPKIRTKKCWAKDFFNKSN